MKAYAARMKRATATLRRLPSPTISPRDSQWAWQSHSGDANINAAITATRECRSVGD